MASRHFARAFFLIIFVAAITRADSSQHPQVLREAEQSFNLARRLEQAGNLEQAMAIYTRLLDEFPGNIQYYQRMKYLLRNNARYAELIEVINDHLDLYPDDIQSRVELGDIQLAQGDKEGAIAIWEDILQRFPLNQMAERLVLTHFFSNGLTQEGTQLLTQLREEKNDSSFFALDMGRLYASRLSYDLALDEFLRHLTTQPQAVGLVTNQLLRFPVEPEIMELLRVKLTEYGTPEALRALASLEFKHRNFSQVVALNRQLAVPPREILNLGRDLIGEQEWDLAQSLMEQLINDPKAAAEYEQAILTLAEINEARSQVDQVRLPLSGFYEKNRFFALPFIRVDTTRVSSLRRAMVLYDSLVTTWRNPRARLRTGEIHYRILDDFDSAIEDYQWVLANRSASRDHPTALLRLIDLWIAKGDLQEAEAALQRAMRRMTTREQLNLVEVKGVELILLSGDQDSLMAYIGGELATLGPTDPDFNDLLELSALVRRFQEWSDQYQVFIHSERLLRQNRRSEAIQQLTEALEAELTPVSPILQYRLAHLHALQGSHAEAEHLCMTIPGDTEFTELGQLLAAELADYQLDDPEIASTRYLSFLDTFPMSIYRDAVRLRYRELNPEAD
ncbi:tetratricopeptide repeat protein [Candidatus Neomarinimicrobiota bacterium]